MRTLVLILLLAAASAFSAERVARQGSDEVRVFDTPCVSMETIARMPPNGREGWSKAVGSFSGQKFFGCWKPLGDSVYILWEDGDQGIVPARELKEQPEA